MCYRNDNRCKIRASVRVALLDFINMAMYSVYLGHARASEVSSVITDHDLRSNTENTETCTSLIPLSLRTLDSTIYFKGRTVHSYRRIIENFQLQKIAFGSLRRAARFRK